MAPRRGRHNRGGRGGRGGAPNPPPPDSTPPVTQLPSDTLSSQGTPLPPGPVPPGPATQGPLPPITPSSRGTPLPPGPLPRGPLPPGTLAGDTRRVTSSGRIIQRAQMAGGQRIPFGRRTSMLTPAPSSNPFALPSSSVEALQPLPSSQAQTPRAKRSQIIEISSSPEKGHGADSGSPGLSPSKPRVKRSKVSSSMPQRNRMPVTGLSVKQQDALDLPSQPFEAARADFPSHMIYHNFDRYNRDKVQSAIEGIKVELSHDLVSPRQRGIEKSVEPLLSLPEIRQFSPMVKSYTKLGQASAIKGDLNVWAMAAKTSSEPQVRMIYYLPQDDYNSEEANLVCRTFVEILNRWPGDISLLTKDPENFRNGSFHARLLTLACRHRLLPHKSVICPLPGFCRPKVGGQGIAKGFYFQVFVSCMHPETYKQRDDRKAASSSTFGPDAEVPEPSERYQFVLYNTRGSIKQSVSKVPPRDGQPSYFPSLLPDETELQISPEERKGLQNAERLLRLYSAAVTNQGGLIDTKGCLNIWTSLVEKYGGVVNRKGGASRGIYGGSDLLQIFPIINSTNTSVSPGRTVAQKLRETDQGFSLPVLTIRSIDRAWVLGVEQAISDEWLLSGDILKAWSRGAEIADETNQSIKSGHRPPSSCACTTEMMKVESHPCSHCGTFRICDQLVSNQFDGRRVCPSCATELAQRPTGQRITENLARSIHSRLVYDQRASKGLVTDDEVKSLFEESFAELKGRLPSAEEAAEADLPSGMAWRDYYSGQLYSLKIENTSTSRTLPDKPSLDAIFPAWPTKFGYRLHCPGNLALTLQAINYMKSVQVPAFLAMTCWYEHERFKIEKRFYPNVWGPEARVEFDQLETQMVNISRRLRIIRLTFGWTKLRRMELNSSAQDFEDDMIPLISGQPQKELLQSIERLDSVQNFVIWGPEIQYPEQDLARLRTLVEEIQEFFGVQLPQGSDGCPFFAHPASMPQAWNWPIAFKLAADRLDRMKRACNRYFPTYDTVETIFLECIFQVCVVRCVLKSGDEYYDLKAHLKSKYASILDLPISIAFRDGLTFAIGHAEHGRGMYTGWPPSPHSLDQRLDADADNNVRVEPRSENFLKADYDPSTYDALKRMVMNIDLPESVYNKTLKPKALSQEEVEFLKWDGQEIDEDEDLFDEAFKRFDPVSDAMNDAETTSALPEKMSGDFPMRVKSNETNYSDTGLPLGELGAQWDDTMAKSSFKATGRIPSDESKYSDILSTGAMDELMQSQYDVLMADITARRIAVDGGFRTLLEDLRDAKDNGNEAGFMAVIAVIRAELAVLKQN
ncbi:unnamed protein product [Fusarium equiseti]|uniref:Uncharacterized protein n=1 Tax=Fusarium equiseti TaxID=61235 RepID=A0A8J2NAX8_FUSEQ|nr:unnamed protein product [Fusarium equiseti]